MHLVVLTIGIRHPLLTSDIKHDVLWLLRATTIYMFFCILFILLTAVNSRCEICIIQISRLTLPLYGTPVSNRIKLISSLTRVPVLHFCPWQYMRSSTNSQTVLYESQNTQIHDMPIPRQTLMQNGHLRSFKVNRFVVNEKPLRDYIVALYVSK